MSVSIQAKSSLQRCPSLLLHPSVLHVSLASRPLAQPRQGHRPLHLYKTLLFSSKTNSFLVRLSQWLDHFVCSTTGVTLTSHGGAMVQRYVGGCLMVDLASSGMTHVEHQKHFNTHETLEAIKQFEQMALAHNVIITEYMSDSGSAFTSEQFRAHLAECRQIIQFAGTGAHHHNSVDECTRSALSCLLHEL